MPNTYEVKLSFRLIQSTKIRVRADSPKEAETIALLRADKAAWSKPQPYDDRAEVDSVEMVRKGQHS